MHFRWPHDVHYLIACDSRSPPKRAAGRLTEPRGVEGGVTVRGWIRTRTESWANVAGFGFAQPNPIFRFAVYIVVLLNDGSQLHTYGLTTSDEESKFALRTVAAMEALRPS